MDPHPENGGITFLRNVGTFNHYAVKKPERMSRYLHCIYVGYYVTIV
jgi:hypothetical protein